MRPPRALLVAAGRHRGGVGELHLRHRQPHGLRRHGGVRATSRRSMDRDEVIHELIDIQYDRNDYEQKRGTFRVRGDALDVFPPYADHPVRIEFWGDEIESIDEIDQVTGEVLNTYEALPIWPASHYVTARPKMDKALGTIQDELRERLMQFKEEGKLLEAQRLGDARELRPGDAGDDGLLLRHRELLAPSGRARAGRAALHPHRLLPRRTSSASSTSPTSRCRRSAACTRATAPARSPWPSTASACPAAWTTAPCASTSSRSASRSSSTCRPRPATTRSA